MPISKQITKGSKVGTRNTVSLHGNVVEAEISEERFLCSVGFFCVAQYSALIALKIQKPTSNWDIKLVKFVLISQDWHLIVQLMQCRAIEFNRNLKQLSKTCDLHCEVEYDDLLPESPLN